MLDVLQAAMQKGLPLDALAFEPDGITTSRVDVSGREIVEVEILKEALDVARAKKPTLPLVSWSDQAGASR